MDFAGIDIDLEIGASSLQFVKRPGGVKTASQVKEDTFNRAVDSVSSAAQERIGSLIPGRRPNIAGNRRQRRMGAPAGAR